LLAKNLKFHSIDSPSIGIFDSGFGGLTIMKSLVEMLPEESIIYFGDSARAPYGDRSSKEIVKFSLQAADFLAQKKIKILVIACNTVCAFAAKIVEKRLKIPVFEIITPSYKAALRNCPGHNIGVLGTKATIRSKVYKKLIEKADSKAKVFSLSCPLFVPLLEEGHFDDKLAYQLAELYLKPLIKKKLDTLLLACTHYPLMKETIQKVIGKDVKIVDPSSACSNEILEFLKKQNLKAPLTNIAKYEFYTSGETEKFRNMAEIFLGKKIDNVIKI
jgi:glutamate racemase